MLGGVHNKKFDGLGCQSSAALISVFTNQTLIMNLTSALKNFRLISQLLHIVISHNLTS